MPRRLVIVAAAAVGLAGCGEGPEMKRLHRDFAVLVPAMEDFNRDCGRMPTQAEGLAALATRPASPDVADRWNGPYAGPSHFNDYWERPYVYLPVKGIANRKPELALWSAGKDGVPYTRDDVYEFTHLLPPWEGKPD